MVRLPPYVVIFLVSSLSLLLLGTSDDRLTPGEFISLNETLVSDAGEFVFGFFSPTNSTGDFYAGVWYNNIPQRTVIWVANREKPINDSSATLRISDDSNLVIVDSEGGIFWSSNLSGFGKPGNDTAAVLYNSGNLVLRANSHNILWQSFDHPTDTFVPGMKIQYNYRKHSATYFTSWKDANDPSPGNFSLGINSSTSIQTLIWSGTKLYRRNQVWIGKMLTGSRAINTSVAYLTMLEYDDEVSITLSVSDASLYIRYTLNYLGQIELLIWDKSSKNWTKYSSVPNYKCETYGWCGQFAYCDSTESVPACKCMEGFKPKVQSDWENGNFSAGCIRKKALRCGDGDGFLSVEGMKLPDHVVLLGNRNIGDCRTACLTNCSCTAYAYSDVTTGNATISRCLIWVGELIDTEMLSSGGEDLYLRLMDIRTSGSKTKTRRIVIIVSLSAIIVSLACIFILWKFSEGKLLCDLSSCTDFANNISGSNEFIEGKPHQGPELPLIGFENILLATNNFSESNKLGKGGFGIVYKARGQEISVKRLVRGFGQGLEEFKNEVILIAKLQHRNLVKLLACCIHGEEKLLVYEYMPDKSLDFFLFGSLYGYMSPEYAMEGLFSVKSDVYSYGVLLLEIVSGFRNSSFHFIMDCPNLLAYAWELWNEGKANDYVDSSIADTCSSTEVLRSIHVGLLCVQDSPNDRPVMSSVVFMLENEEATISAAPKQPIFTIQ
ncbi:unnamed protein product, partial [Musa acuminata subsp. malaccensis]